jgi:hypothetical protein
VVSRFGGLRGGGRPRGCGGPSRWNLWWAALPIHSALRLLTGGESTSPPGSICRPVWASLLATDNLQSPRYRGLLPEDLIEILTINRLGFDQPRESGVLFHLIGAVSQYGKLGLTAVGNSHAEVDELYQRTLSVLEAETGYG